MLSIVKINSEAHQAASPANAGGYLHYLGEPSTRAKKDFDAYARGGDGLAPPPFWACKGPAMMGLDGIAEAEHVERLARGFHPVTGAPLVVGAGRGHVMGLDLTFSAPKDVSAVFAAADDPTRVAILEALRESAKAALDYAESQALTRHGKGGRIKQAAEAAFVAAYTHFASRALDPALHIHAMMFNVGKRAGADEHSAMEAKAQFERKMATGILFRAELASRMRGLGFSVLAAGPYFAIAGISQDQRDALSTRSAQIAERMREDGVQGADYAAQRVAALNSRKGKQEPPLDELLRMFEEQARALGLTREAVASMRGAQPLFEPLAMDHEALLDELVASQSCATEQEALALICEKAMGVWSAAECRDELARFMASPALARLGQTETLSEVFTSKATKELEAQISERVAEGAPSRVHRVARRLVDKEFDRMERELSESLGVAVSFHQQREAAAHVACDSGRHAFVEGWAGTGKTSMLRGLALAYQAAGFSVAGCCQSASAAQNLARETGIRSRTIASLLLALRDGRARLHAKSILVVDECGMVGSREFSELQAAALAAGAKLACVGDSKQLAPVEFGPIFGSLVRLHGKAEISAIQRQRTDFEPLMKWLESRGVGPEKAKALRALPEDSRMQTLSALCGADPKLAKAFERWRSRFDYEWMREAVGDFATGNAEKALALLESKGRLKLAAGQEAALAALVAAWAADKTEPRSKAMIAGTRAEVAELNRRGRDILIARGLVDDAGGIDVCIVRRDETREVKRFAPGDRIVFTMNDRELGVFNGVSGDLVAVDRTDREPILEVELDDPREDGSRRARIPAAWGRFDLSLCFTNHKAQGRTFDSAYVLANPGAALDRHWIYVAASRSRFATTLFVNAALLGLVDPEGHQAGALRPKTRRQSIAALAARMSSSRNKGTTLDFGPSTLAPEALKPMGAGVVLAAKALLERLRDRARCASPEPSQ